MEFVPSPPKNKSYAQAWHDKLQSGGFNTRPPYAMREEEELGLVPSTWSVSSAMNDPRPVITSPLPLLCASLPEESFVRVSVPAERSEYLRRSLL